MAITSPTAPGWDDSGRSSRTRNTVLVGSMPGTLATRTASSRKRAHSTVLAGQRPDTRKPLSTPWAWKGDTSTEISSCSCISTSCSSHTGVGHMVNHIGVGTQAPESANLMRHMRVRTNGLIPGEPKEPSPESKELA